MGNGALRRVRATLATLGNGTIAVRGAAEDGPADPPGLLIAAGAYGLGADGLVRPLPGPAVSDLLDEAEGGLGRRELDLYAGTLVREPLDEGVRSVHFVSLTRPGIAAVVAEDPRPVGTWAPPLAAPTGVDPLAAEHEFATGSTPDPATTWAMTTSDRAAISVAAHQRTVEGPTGRRLERLIAVAADRRPEPETALALLEDARQEGVDALLREHRQEWARRWAGADIEIDGDPGSQLAVRFALFHLLSCAPTAGEAVIGARGLTGFSYAGHVFWDTDVFVVPALSAVLPAAARAAIEYRLRRLPTARDAAADRGLPGARFPWESADSGEEVTPATMRDLEGNTVPIRNGERADHINADVAWSVLQHVDWTGDQGLLTGSGRDLVLDTARFWAARIRTDNRGAAHLYGVIGPDEYHEVVDDNAYTNGMARWHLVQAAAVARAGGNPAEAEQFEAMAKALVDGYDPRTGRHEQFAGFWALEPLLIGEVAEPPVAADLLLGRDRVRRSQVIKQPDVLMLHHLIPDTCPPGSLAADLDFYLPRTAHGSSLSPAICASLLARAGRPDDAMALFDVAARLDLDDLTGTTAGGLHLATMGGLWQAVVLGFAGIHPGPEALAIDPHLPTRWDRLTVRLQFRGEPLRITLDHESVTVECDRPVPVNIAGTKLAAPTRMRLPRAKGDAT